MKPAKHPVSLEPSAFYLQGSMGFRVGRSIAHAMLDSPMGLRTYPLTGMSHEVDTLTVPRGQGKAFARNGVLMRRMDANALPLHPPDGAATLMRTPETGTTPSPVGDRSSM
jgi:hypothetical protein